MILPPPTYRDFVLPDLMRWRRTGLKTALLTLISTTGASPRPVGSQLAVCETGEAVGLITGGCAEGALVHDALAAMAAGENRTELYGEGSRFKDITLPCGSGLLVHFDVGGNDDGITAVIAARAARQPTELIVTPDYRRRYLPACRLVVIGQGQILAALMQLAPLMEVELDVWSPDGGQHRLIAPEDFDASILDRYSAQVLVFHDHGFEPELLLAGLKSDAFFIGALGSRRAHARRLEILAGLGATPEALARIHGPVGLAIGAASPPEIALSIMAQVIATWRKDLV